MNRQLRQTSNGCRLAKRIGMTQQSSLVFLMLLAATFVATCHAFVVRTSVPAPILHQHMKSQQSPCLLYAAVGIFFGTSTGNTQDCADKLYEALVSKDIDVAEPIDIDTLDSGSLKDVFQEHNALIVGTPTWNTNADTFRSGTGWDDLYYDKLPELTSILVGKKVAVFGLGDQISYGENYADATGELYSVFESLGCNMVPYAHTSQDGYDHITSKSILPGSDLFCGLLLDQINQDDLTDGRITNWIEKLELGGFFDADGSVSAPSATIVSVNEEEEEDNDDDSDELVMVETSIGIETKQAVFEPSPVTVTTAGSNFTPHFNPKTGRTMWTSPDGRKSYLTVDNKSTISP